MTQIPNPHVVGDMTPWMCVFLITSAGAVGGLLNAFMSDNGFALPTRVKGIWGPGALWNVFVGGVAAVTSWALYGSGAGIDFPATTATQRGQISLGLGALAVALIIGIPGSKWLTNTGTKSHF